MNALWCRLRYGHDWRWYRNIYGYEMYALETWSRSEWRCSRCGAYRLRPKPHPEPTSEETTR